GAMNETKHEEEKKKQKRNSLQAKEKGGHTKFRMKIGDEDIRILVFKDTLDSHFEQGTQLHCLALTGRFDPKPPTAYLSGLLLEPIPGSLDEYTRIGLFIMRNWHDEKCFGIRISEEGEFMLAPGREDLLSVIKIF
ncbi:hypothetical protein GJ744_006865, partial [Endocarpon pusillum]